MQWSFFFGLYCLLCVIYLKYLEENALILTTPHRKKTEFLENLTKPAICGCIIHVALRWFEVFCLFDDSNTKTFFLPSTSSDSVAPMIYVEKPLKSSIKNSVRFMNIWFNSANLEHFIQYVHKLFFIAE